MQGESNVDSGSSRRLFEVNSAAIGTAALIRMARKGTVEIPPVIEIVGLPTKEGPRRTQSPF